MAFCQNVNGFSWTVVDCKYQQSSFRYAPAALLGLPLVNAIDQEGHDIDDYQII